MSGREYWEDAITEYRRSVGEDYPESMRRRLQEIVDEHDEKAQQAGDLTWDEASRRVGDLGCALPTPLRDIQPMMETWSKDGVLEALQVLAAEVLELRARVATLEEARS
jgi:polyhydroxyalkanoate synthesis regulator phasin